MIKSNINVHKNEREEIIGKPRGTLNKSWQKGTKVNPRSFYAYIRGEMKTKDRVGPLCDSSGETITDSMGMCGIVNEFFASVFTDEKTGEQPEVKDMFNEQESSRLSDVCITVEIVHSMLKKLALYKAFGVDGIMSEILVANADILSELLCQFIVHHWIQVWF